MIATVKLAGLSAVLSAGLFSALAAPGASAPPASPTGKTYTDRIVSELPPARPSQVISFGSPTGGADISTTETGTVTGKGDVQRRIVRTGCAAQTWPFISRDCLAAADGTPARVVARTVTVEMREGANTSVLARSAPTATASR